MPYTAKQKRETLDPLIDQLADRITAEIKTSGDQTSFAGMLNYSCTRLAIRVVRLSFGQIRYWMIAMLVGVFHNIADELYRRIGVPYEEREMQKSGDVDEYKKVVDSL